MSDKAETFSALGPSKSSYILFKKPNDLSWPLTSSLHSVMYFSTNQNFYKIENRETTCNSTTWTELQLTFWCCPFSFQPTILILQYVQVHFVSSFLHLTTSKHFLTLHRNISRKHLYILSITICLLLLNT